MRIGTNVLSMNARQSLYENEKRMNVALSTVWFHKQIKFRKWFRSYYNLKYNL